MSTRVIPHWAADTLDTPDPLHDSPEVRAKIAAQPQREQGDADDGPEQTTAPTPARAYSPKLYTSAEFFATKFQREFLVRGVLVKGQPAVLGGPKKVLKSGVAIDLAISLDTATPFLGFERFAVPKPVKVLLLNGESGNATVQETAARIAKARGIDTSDLNVIWGADLPQLASAEHLRDLADLITERRVEVLIVDPTYLCLMAGVRADGPQASSLFDMGGIYSQFARVVLEAGATPILSSHAKKCRGFEPLDLDDLAYAGIAEFARQWCLLSRREAYQGDGVHKLWLNLGGSAGHSFIGHLDIEEGAAGDDFEGRFWKTSVEGYQEAKREQKSGRDVAKLAERQADEMTVMGVLDAMAARDETATVTRIRNASGLPRQRTDSALERLRGRLVEEYGATVASGNGAAKAAIAYRRVNVV